MKRCAILCLLAALVLPPAGVFAREGLYVGAGFGYNDIAGGVNGDYLDQATYFHNNTGNSSFKKDMVPFTIAGHLQYNFLPYLFIRTGVNYTKATEGKLNYNNNQNTAKYNFASWEIPLTIGLSIDVAGGKACLNLGFGMSYGSAVLTETDYTNGVEDREMKFEYAGFGPHVLAGIQYFITKSLGLFFEFQMTSNHGMADATYLAPTNFAYDVNAGGKFYRFGMVYKAF